MLKEQLAALQHSVSTHVEQHTLLTDTQKIKPNQCKNCQEQHLSCRNYQGQLPLSSEMSLLSDGGPSGTSGLEPVLSRFLARYILLLSLSVLLNLLPQCFAFTSQDSLFSFLSALLSICCLNASISLRKIYSLIFCLSCSTCCLGASVSHRKIYSFIISLSCSICCLSASILLRKMY